MITITQPFLRTSDSEAPVFGPVRFIGRAGLVRNLAGRCSRWQSMLLYGGPKLGKTSFLLQLRWVLERQETPSWTSPAVHYLDLRDHDMRRKFLLGEWEQVQVLLLDNCEHLTAERDLLTDRVKRDVQKGSSSQAIVWAGDRTWYEFARSAKSELDLHAAPLAVLLASEARSLIGPALQPAQVEMALHYGGTHPHVLKVLRSQLLSMGLKATVKPVMGAATEQLAPMFDTCVQSVQEPLEQKLLKWLVRKSKPVNPREAAKALKVSSVKSAADTLCYLGLISRWNLADGAVLQANCKLFNDWYLATQ